MSGQDPTRREDAQKQAQITGSEATISVSPETQDPAAQNPVTHDPTVATGSLAVPSRELLAGRYELLGLLGVGGMGSVYRARDRELDEIVALKVLRRELVDSPGMLERFRQEVRLARRVTHKNVARTFDIGEHGSDKFLTMEFIEGESVSALARRHLHASARPLPIERVVEIASAICAGLGAAHAAGIVHRDLKPDNVLVGKDGRIAITDFGIARAFVGEVGSQTIGGPVGTPAYMAPEQVEGARDVDARADIYALGAMLYELFTGEVPWKGESIYQVAVLRLTQPVPDPRLKRADLMVAAGELVRRAMARKREDRYATIEEVAHVLANLTLPQAVMTTAPSPARPVPRVDPPADHKTLAVLPFRNIGKKDDDYLADGLTDDLIDSLSMAQGLRVRSRGAVMRFKGIERDARELGRELEVQVVVEGSVRKVGEMLRVSARLVSVADGFQLWAKRFDRPEKDFLAVGDEAADAITAALTVERSGAAREAPTDPRVIDLYLRARHEYHKFWKDTNRRAITLFEEALALAPDNATVLSGYALAKLRHFALEPDDRAGADEAGEVGRKSAERALALAPHLGEPRAALAALHWAKAEWNLAAKMVREALALAPSNPDLYDLYGQMLAEVGKLDAAAAVFRTAQSLEPQNSRLLVDMARVRALVGDWSHYEAMTSTAPTDPFALNGFFFGAARLMVWRKDKQRATELLAATEGLTFDLRDRVRDLANLVLSGEAYKQKVSDELRRWANLNSRARRRPIFFRQLAAEAQAVAGNAEGVLEMVESADSLGLLDKAWMDGCPLLAPYRGEERFAAASAHVNERAAEVVRILGTSELAKAR